MTDLHCHILPNIDDGAKDVSISLRLLEKEYADGVRNIAFTSHFNSEWTTPDAFLQKRAAAYETLTAALPTGPEAMQFRFKLGCEVYFSPKLCELDAKRSASAIPLICWWSFPLPTSPISSGRPSPLLQEQGVLPLIAHIERYPYVLEDPTLLYNWVPPEPMSKSTRAHCWILQNCAGRSASSSRGSLSTSSRRTPTPWTNARPGWQKPLLFWKRSWAERLPQSFCRTATHFFDDEELDVFTSHRPKKFLNFWM